MMIALSRFKVVVKMGAILPGEPVCVSVGVATQVQYIVQTNLLCYPLQHTMLEVL